MTADPAALARLSPGEREVLLLLGRGHTAKSIATATSLSVHAVNERLREARRKTGAGSSRELARWLLAQENRPKQIGVEDGSSAADAPGRPSPVAVGRSRRWVMIGGVAIALAAGTMALWGGQEATPATADPVLGTMFAYQDDEPRDLYAQLRREPRDPVWAAATEAALRRRYAAAAGLPETRLRVTCARTLCEVAGPAKGLSRQVVADLQQSDALTLDGLGVRSTAFSIGPDSFAAYLRRDAAGKQSTTPK